MNNCSICGFGVAWCVDKEDKGTYWLCGRCAVEEVMEKIVKERGLVRVARAGKAHMKALYEEWEVEEGFFEDEDIRELEEALKELPEGLID